MRTNGAQAHHDMILFLFQLLFLQLNFDFTFRLEQETMPTRSLTPHMRHIYVF